jgi:predicted nucleotide-binding protein (sugar kinase/HSP70/actin superfamily)
LQGGTQRNLAAVKAQVDYILDRVPGGRVMVHPHSGEAGAIGAALEAMRVVQRRGSSRFVGLDAVIGIEYTTRTDETTRCHFCPNECLRTFIDTRTPDGRTSRYIAGFSCEKGTVESKEAVQELNRKRKQLMAEHPNLVEYEAGLCFRKFYQPAQMPEAGTEISDVKVSRSLFGYGPIRRTNVSRPFVGGSDAAEAHRAQLRIGIPRVLNHYVVGPFLRGYLEALGIPPRSIVFSDESSEALGLAGSKYGSIDPCYPSKVALGHIHNLITLKHRRKPLNFIWFPPITHLPNFISHAVGSNSCPVVAGTPSVTKAAYTKERDVFDEAGIECVCEALNFEIPHLLRDQLFRSWGKRLNISEDENEWACGQAWMAMRLFDEELQRWGLEILTEAEANNKVALLLLARPYHNDQGLNHGILEEFQALGYPILTIRSIPKDPNYLERFFEADLQENLIDDVFDLRDVWPENYSTHSAQKVWAAKFAARHRNLCVVDLSSFKCGHDAPIYGMIDNILAASKTPHLALHDLDANKPGGSIQIRVKTFAYTLGLYEEGLADAAEKLIQLEHAIVEKRAALVARYKDQLDRAIASASQVTQQGLEAAYTAYLEKDRIALGGQDSIVAAVGQCAAEADFPLSRGDRARTKEAARRLSI